MFKTLKASRNINKAAKIISPSESCSSEQIRHTNTFLREMLLDEFPHKDYIAETTPEALAAYYFGIMTMTKRVDDPQYANALALSFYELVGDDLENGTYEKMGAVFFNYLEEIKDFLESHGITAESVNPINRFINK